MSVNRMEFGIFMAPFHVAGESPTAALRRDIDLITHLDRLGYDEMWAGEHHSGGWEIITSPEVFLAAAGERTDHIRLGTGVVSLPYHQPFMVADRIVMLDHLTRGRAMLGVGPGALPGDARFLGLDPTRQRDMMNEALGIIIKLLQGEAVTHETDWFELHDARLQLLPYQRPMMPLAVANMITPTGMVCAGTHGIGVLSIASYTEAGINAAKTQWGFCERAAAQAGRPAPDRKDWRLVVPFHLAATREQAISDIEDGVQRWYNEYLINTLGAPGLQPVESGRQLAEGMNSFGGAIIGTPDDAIASIKRLQEITGGFGTLLGFAHEWTTREKIEHSFELMARYVMPEFQGTNAPTKASLEWTLQNKESLMEGRKAALDKAMAQHAAPVDGAN